MLSVTFATLSTSTPALNVIVPRSPQFVDTVGRLNACCTRTGGRFVNGSATWIWLPATALAATPSALAAALAPASTALVATPATLVATAATLVATLAASLATLVATLATSLATLVATPSTFVATSPASLVATPIMLVRPPSGLLKKERRLRVRAPRARRGADSAGLAVDELTTEKRTAPWLWTFSQRERCARCGGTHVLALPCEKSESRVALYTTGAAEPCEWI
jgi:hypothetical protein